MHKLPLLVIASLCALVSNSQKTDTLSIFYNTDQYKLSKPDKQRLDSFITRGWDKIIINGFTDEVDGDEYNLDLSERRALAVAAVLRDDGVPFRHIETRGMGESDPIATNATEAGRARNRRVEVRLNAGGYPSPKPKPE